jgi:hypothetical protein
MELDRKRLRMAMLGNRQVPMKQVSELVNRLRREVPDAPTIGYSQMQKANHEAFDEVKTVLQVPMDIPNVFSWEIADFRRLVERCVSSSDVMKDLFERQLQKHPCSKEAPWEVRALFF